MPEPQMQSHEAIGRRAAAFFEQRRFGEWSAADQMALDSWLAESPLHRVAYLRVEWNLEQARKLAPLRLSESVEEPRKRRLSPWHLAVPLLAASSVALLLGQGNIFASAVTQPSDRTYSTELGGHAVIKFADNTQIELNTNSIARVRMTTAERTVWLEKGEAWFRVAHNTAHPFSVIVGRHRVTDLGTEFLVRRMSDGMEVALVKGEAALKSESAQAAILSPGDDAVATAQSTTITRKTPQELADALAWRRGMLVFRNTRLADAVAEFNRYNATKLTVADPSIADLKVSAEMERGNYEGFLQLAEDVFDLRVERDGQEIRIFGASRKAAHAKRSR